MSLLRMLVFSWWMQLKLRSRSAFDGVLALVWPIFFATTIFLMFQQGNASGEALIGAALGSSVLGVWSATSTTASAALQHERRQGTLELLVATPSPFPLLIAPLTLSMATVGAYSLVATLLWGRLVFGIPIHIEHWPAFMVSMAVTVLSVGLLGFLLAVSSVRYRSAWAVGAALEMPVWLIGGFVVPLAQLPGWVHPLSWALAPTWGYTALKNAAFGGPWVADAVLCLGIGIGYAALGTVLCTRLLHSARVNASLALS